MQNKSKSMLPPKKKFKEATLSPSEQRVVDKHWESEQKTKLPKGEHAKLESEAYNSWKKTGNLSGAYYNPEPKPEPVKRVEVGKLPTRGVPTPTKPSMEIIRHKDATIDSSKEKGKFTPTAKTKRLSSGGKSVAGQNVATTAKNIIGKAKYARQQKMAEAGKKALRGEGAVGPSSTAKLEALREKKSALKEARKATGVKVGKEMREVKKGIRYEKKVLRGKDVYKR